MLTSFVCLLLLQTPAGLITWHDVRQFGVEGQGWSETKQPFDRLPARAEGVVRPPVWSLAEDSAGLSVRFSTDAPTIRARWSLREATLALPHMPATGVSGLDLYVRHQGRWRWLANGRPTKQSNEQALIEGWTGGRRDYLLYLPLYNGVSSLEIGVPAGAVLERGAPWPPGMRPVVFYGSSILQGGCASRPGMAYPAILARMLDRPAINLGFSGNALTEPEMAGLLAELNPAVYVLDSLPNLTPEWVRERVEPFIGKLRQAHPTTPIVLVENVIYTNSDFVEAQRKSYSEKNAALRAIFLRLKKAGDRKLFYVPATHLLGDDGEATVDSVHPTDLGFLRMAQTIAPVLRRALK
jgi:hypothetical protein